LLAKALGGGERSAPVNTPARLLFVLLILGGAAASGAARGSEQSSTNAYTGKAYRDEPAGRHLA
jgi:hypothetical protein